MSYLPEIHMDWLRFVVSSSSSSLPQSACRLFIPPAVALAALLVQPHAHAASATWSGSAANGNLWETSGNWAGSPAAVPGSADTATFDATATSSGVIDLGAGGVTVKTILLSGTTCPSYTFGAGAVDSQMLNFVGGGGFSGGSGNSPSTTLTCNATITLGTAASYSFGATAGPNTVVFNGKVYPASSVATGSATVNGGGRSQTFNGVLSDGVGGCKLAVAPGNGQTITLTNSNNTFSGGIYLSNSTVSVGSIK